MATKRDVAAVGKRLPIIWVHITKAGGTTMCQLAHMMHERVVRPADPNCNWRGVDFFQLSSAEPYAPQYASYPSCEVRAAYFAAHGYTYAQVERPIESSDICPQQFMYGTSTQCCF